MFESRLWFAASHSHGISELSADLEITCRETLHVHCWHPKDSQRLLNVHRLGLLTFGFTHWIPILDCCPTEMQLFLGDWQHKVLPRGHTCWATDWCYKGVGNIILNACHYYTRRIQKYTTRIRLVCILLLKKSWHALRINWRNLWHRFRIFSEFSLLTLTLFSFCSVYTDTLQSLCIFTRRTSCHHPWIFVGCSQSILKWCQKLHINRTRQPRECLLHLFTRYCFWSILLPGLSSCL